MNQKSPFCLLLLAYCILAGCSKFVPVEGTVTMDGRPVAGASVVFHPEEEQPGQRDGPRQASGATDDNGHFTLRTVNKEGAWAGSYRVTVSKRELPPDKKKEFEKTGTLNSEPPPGIDPKLLEEGKAKGLIAPRPVGPGSIPINLGDFMKETLPEIYLSLKSTPLRIEVPKGGTKEANLELKSKP